MEEKSFPPLPPDVLDFLEFVKNWKFNDPHPLTNWEKFEIRNIMNFEKPPPQKKNVSLKHLKLLKNHLKTNFFLFNLSI